MKLLPMMRTRGLCGSLVCDNIKTVGNAFSAGILGEITTKMLTFNGSTAYGSLPEPWVSTDGNWTAEVVFEASSLTSAHLIDGDSATTPIFVAYKSDGNITFSTALCTAEIDGVSATDSVTAMPTDGALHTVTLTGTAQGRVGFIGALDTPAEYFNGIIKSVKLTDLTTPANSREYRLNSGNTLYELPQGESLGSELVTNGDFSDTASIDTTIAPLAGWTNTGTHNALNKCTIENGAMRLISDGTSIGVIQDIVEVGKTYLVTFDLLQNDGAGVKITQYVNNVNYGGTGTGSKSWVFTASGLDTNVYIQRQSGACDAIIDNFSVKEIPKALLYNNVVAGDWGDYYFDASLGTNGGWVSKTELVSNGRFDTDSDWTKSGGWTISSGVASIDGAAGALVQALNLPIKPYLFKFTVIERNAGSFLPMINGTTGTGRSIAGTYTEIITPALATGNTGLAFGANNGSIDNVSVREVILV